MEGEQGHNRTERIRVEAADWFARLDAPHGPEDQLAFEAWAAEDPDHAAAFDRLVRRWERSAFLKHTDTGRRHRRERARIAWKHTVAIAATLAMLGLLGVMALAQRGADPAMQLAEARTTLRTDVGEIRTVRLADGSQVILDTDTVAEVRVDENARAVRLLRGRARFAVAHDPGRRFRVAAGPGLVIAHGTIFDVAVHARGAQVRLLQGRVEVRDRRTPGKAGQYLQPNNGTAVEHDSGVARPTPVRADEARWPSGMIFFDQRSLVEAATEMNRYNRLQIKVAASITPLRLTGGFRATDARGFAAAAAAALNLTVDDSRPDLLLLRPHD